MEIAFKASDFTRSDWFKHRSGDCFRFMDTTRQRGGRELQRNLAFTKLNLYGALLSHSALLFCWSSGFWRSIRKLLWLLTILCQIVHRHLWRYHILSCFGDNTIWQTTTLDSKQVEKLQPQQLGCCPRLSHPLQLQFSFSKKWFTKVITWIIMK